MRIALPARLRRLAGYATAAVLAVCLVVLLVDSVHWSNTYAASRESLDQAEQAAREAPTANDALYSLVEQQTDESLARDRRIRTFSLGAIVSTAVMVLLLRSPATGQPALPETIQHSLPRPNDTTPTSTGDEPSIVAPASTGQAPPPIDLTKVSDIVDRTGNTPQQLIAQLHAIQEEYRYLPTEALDELCRITGTTPAHVAGVASFYARFRTTPCGKHRVEVCRGTACHVAGADRVVEELYRHFGIAPGNDTDLAQQVTVETVGCLGCCDLAPVVSRDGELSAHVRVEDLPEIVEACLESPKSRKYRPRKGGNNATANGQLSWQQLLDWCARRLGGESPADDSAHAVPAAELLSSAESNSDTSIITGLWAGNRQQSLDEYEQQGGFAALAKCLSALKPVEVLSEIDISGLRGRGGGGFPTVRKWRIVADGSGDKYVVCNGDEGDPGAFMDRSIMETSPASVLEGMLIAGYAVGASRGVVYVRGEYPVAVRRMRETIEQLKAKGYLGQGILGSSFDFSIELVEGGGAFVCGEETALIESIMGHRGTPHHRPPYPAVAGLWGRPTLVNNVETLAAVPWILRHGGQPFADLGSTTSKGTKVFSLAGKIRRGGLVEAPMGTTIRQLIDDYGGGVPEGRTLKAVQIGGPSGGCIPAELCDTPVDYEALRELGAIMGSGGLVVLDDTDCMVDVARYFLEFTQQESCGHCTFCRVGTRKLLDLLNKLCEGKASPHDLNEIESLAHGITLGSLCGLGKTAPNPVITTLRYFRHEYEAHLKGHCPSARCKPLVDYVVTHDCVGCTLCAQHCPVAAIEATPYKQHTIDLDLCTRCDACRTTCPELAIETVSPRAKAAPRKPVGMS
ncbi:NAD(P)H-dependent oxidoreductase subunit E [Aeoliella mucimassa]|uniref:NADP-reducing hydrogenase subunit HndC n=1 Tax=Aeoliella mucimassa TaxID=2527972 RepID=A0A518AT41_9BACT|nr:NAD(P)H-dependent oxidoreductase subunit E [Aeoliella mucimassa]QDU57899.1 NADP-reducing hydrogenase subunit HndC [Aeoliella mucimassa]